MVDLIDRRTFRLDHQTIPRSLYEDPKAGWQTVVYDDARDRLWMRGLSDRKWITQSVTTRVSNKQFAGIEANSSTMSGHGTLAAFCDEWVITIWDLETDRVLFSIPSNYVQTLSRLSIPFTKVDSWSKSPCISFAPNISLLAIQEPSGLVIWNIKAAKPVALVRPAKAYGPAVSDFAFLGSELLAVADDQGLNVIDLQGRTVETLDENGYYRLVICNAENDLILAANKESIGVFDATSRQQKLRLNVENVVSLKISPNADVYAIATENGMVQIRDLRDGQEIWTCSPDRTRLYSFVPLLLLLLWSAFSIFSRAKRTFQTELNKPIGAGVKSLRR